MRLKKPVEYTFLKCPRCGHLYSSLVATANMWTCNNCGYKTTKIDEWKKEKQKVLAFKCLQCKNYIENTSDNVNWCGVFKEIVCPTCSSIVAINGKHILEHEKLTEKDLMVSEKIDKNLYIFHVKTHRQRMLTRILNIKARKEESSFKNVPSPKIEKTNDNQYAIHSKKKLIGYISFTPKWRNNIPLLNQAYVIPTERRKGYASKLVEYFIKRNCNTSLKTWFIAESPNEKGYSLLVEKLGLGDKIKTVCLG